ncbi:MAG: hypothetical protein RLZZ587_958 [Actinomycetota bacterium]
MFEITNTPRPYSWGSTLALAELRGVEPSGQPEAELWFGDHAGCPSVRVADGRTLVEWEGDDSTRAQLPFLLKILAVATPLSIQVHPDRDSARVGFERENAAGVGLDANHRNYKDSNHKPEIIRAVTEFSALCGFRPASERMDILVHLIGAGVPGAAALALACEGGVRGGVEWIVSRHPAAVELATALAGPSVSTGLRHVDDAIATARLISTAFPGDSGVAMALLLNHVVLKPGEALAVPAGTVHAYLSGVGVEVMASSDNVLRGGLTSKHIDVEEFLAVITWNEERPELIEPLVSDATRELRADFPDCALTEIDVDGLIESDTEGPSIALLLDGEVTAACTESVTLSPGRAIFIESGDSPITFTGRGTIVIASGVNAP